MSNLNTYYDSNDYYVVKILNDHELIITRGENDTFAEGDEFDVLSNQLQEIKNPITGEILDTIPLPKDRLILSYSMPKYSVLTTRYVTSDISILNSNSLNKFKSERKKMNISDTDADDIFRKRSNEPIKVGDLVKRIAL